MASNIHPEGGVTVDRYLNIVNRVQLTIDRGPDHGGESSEECEEAKCAGEVVQAEDVHEDDGGQGDVGS